MKSENKNQRTKDICEELNHYSKPPLIPQAVFDEKAAIKNSKANSFQRFLFKTYLSITNYESFKKNIHSNLENILRKSDNQSGALFAPVVSATISIKNDKRQISPTERASSLLIGAREFYSDLLHGRLKPDKFKDSILEMGYYPNFFSTTQFIENKKVSLYKTNKTSQILIIVNNRYFITEIGEIGTEISAIDIKLLLDEIVKHSKEKSSTANQNSPGILTCTNSRTQTAIFFELNKIDSNKNSLEKIKDSFLTICLDLDFNPEDSSKAARISHIGNPENRWYHTSLQIVVFGNSKACIVCNFSNSISGNNMMRVASEIQKRAELVPILDKANNSINDFGFKELFWNIKDEYIVKSKSEISSFIDNQQATFIINSIGKNIFDQNKFKPIPTFVIALQLTIRSLLKKDARITQFVSLSKNRCMDLTTAVVTTPETVNFVNNVESKKQLNSDLKELLKSSIESQQKKIRKARNTLTIIHMLQLQAQASYGFKKFYIIILQRILFLLLRISGFFKDKIREIVISHPDIYEEVDIVGRPGVRIPYAKYFGLHYQIMEEKIVITMMPGVNWKIPNEKFIEELEKNLLKIKSIVS